MKKPEELRDDLKARLDTAGATLADLAKISSVPASTLSNFIANRFTPTIDEVQRIDRVLTRIENLARVCRPVPVNFKDSELVKLLMTKLDRNEMAVLIADTGQMSSLALAGF